MKIPVHHYIDISEKTVREVFELKYFLSAGSTRFIKSIGDKTYLVEVWS